MSKRPSTSQEAQTNTQTRNQTNESTKLYNADQAQGADYFRPQNPVKTNQSSSDIDASSIPGSKPAKNQTRKPE